MNRSPEELAQTERFEQSYVNLQSTVMLSIERQVCGCDYGGNSWTTRDEAQRIGAMLGLKAGCAASGCGCRIRLAGALPG